MNTTTTLDAAILLVRHHRLTERDVASALVQHPEGTPMSSLLHELLTAAEVEAGP